MTREEVINIHLDAWLILGFLTDNLISTFYGELPQNYISLQCFFLYFEALEGYKRIYYVVQSLVHLFFIKLLLVVYSQPQSVFFFSFEKCL